MKVLPRPSALLSANVPPSRRTSSSEIERPRPVPPYFRLIVPSACRNGSNTVFCCSSEMPIPVSMTDSAICSSGTRRILSSTLPFSVNLTAFDSRLRKICSSLCRSVSIDDGHSGSISILNFTSFFSASGAKRSERSLVRRVSATGSGLISMCPASIFDRSRMSLMRVRRSLPEDCIVCA